MVTTDSEQGSHPSAVIETGVMDQQQKSNNISKKPGKDGEHEGLNSDNAEANTTAARNIDADITSKSQVKEAINTDAMTDATSTNSLESAGNGDGGAESKQSNPTTKETTSTSVTESDPDAIKLRFLFANRDGLNVTVECKVTDTVGEIKGALLSMWPEDLPDCSGGESVRLICMGKGILMPDSKTLADLQIPVFKTHPPPVNVCVKPEHIVAAEKAHKSSPKSSENSSPSVDQGCSCAIL